VGVDALTAKEAERPAKALVGDEGGLGLVLLIVVVLVLLGRI
jgi:hypothetical protein